MGLYQLILLDKIPAHAAVSETVALVRRYCRANERTTSFVNAVLRRAAQAAEAGALPAPDCPDKESYYALRYSHPEWLVRLWSAQFGLKTAEALCRADNADTPVSVRVNTIDVYKRQGAGFGTDTNVATLLFADGRRETPPLMSKEALADVILDRLLAMRQARA